jgi:nicotinamidase-related amidase
VHPISLSRNISIFIFLNRTSRDIVTIPVFFTFSNTTMASKTALVLIDVYNDFLHPDGKLYGGLVESLKDSNTIEHLEAVLDAARKHNIPTFYSLHQQYRPGKYAGFEHQNAMLQSIQQNHAFEEGTFGSEVFKSLAPNVEKGDTVISKHWNQRLLSLNLIFS